MTPPTRPQPRRMSAFEKAAAIERDQQWGDEVPGGPPWSDQRKGAALFMAGYDRRGLLNELGWREPFLDPDPLTVEPEPLDERVPVHPKLPARRPGCVSVLPWLVLAVVVWRAVL